MQPAAPHPHPWRRGRGRLRVLGEVVDLRLPETDTWAEAGEICGEITSPTAVSDVYVPSPSQVLDVSTAPADDPGAVNTGPCAVV
ncbi:hypothetical protein [Streptomyces sp.]|uniref:hypothetical protein n=1 Tax=Streptomyces sp. TaxID=1931 RepID=UPI0039C908CA